MRSLVSALGARRDDEIPARDVVDAGRIEDRPAAVGRHRRVGPGRLGVEARRHDDPDAAAVADAPGTKVANAFPTRMSLFERGAPVTRSYVTWTSAVW